jgi:pimeloyl-ACP methyl ester carboxylesterase
MRNWALVAIVTTTTTLVVVPVFVILKYVRISLNIMRSTKPPLARGPLDFERQPGEAVCFPAYDGLELHGLFISASADRPRRGMILFAHEFCSDMHSCARYGRPLQEAGYDVFSFNFRGHGESDCEPDYTPRQWITNREMYDIRGAIAFVQDRLQRRRLPTELGLFGISRGACAAIVAAAECEDVKAIVCDGAYSTDRTIEYFMRRWAYIFAKVRIIYENHHPCFWVFLRWSLMLVARRKFKCTFPSVVKAIRRMSPRPMYFIHGERDSYLPVELSRLLYALAPQPKHFWAAPRAKHNQAVTMHPEKYARLTVSFFDRHLGDASARISPSRFTTESPSDSAFARDTTGSHVYVD